MKQIYVLESVDHATEIFGSFVTSTQVPRRDVMRQVKNGFVKSVGEVSVCDDDGRMLDPERHREGFVLTDKGKEFLAKFYKK